MTVDDLEGLLGEETDRVNVRGGPLSLLDDLVGIAGLVVILTLVVRQALHWAKGDNDPKEILGHRWEQFKAATSGGPGAWKKDTPTQPGGEASSEAADEGAADEANG